MIAMEFIPTSPSTFRLDCKLDIPMEVGYSRLFFVDTDLPWKAVKSKTHARHITIRFFHILHRLMTTGGSCFSSVFSLEKKKGQQFPNTLHPSMRNYFSTVFDSTCSISVVTSTASIIGHVFVQKVFNE